MRSAALIFALLVVLSGVAPVAALGPPGGDATSSAAAAPDAPVYPQRQPPEEPATEIRIELQPNTNARWTVVLRYPLDEANETAGFEALGREFEAGRADVGLDTTLFRSVSSEAAVASGRQMGIRNVSRVARVENETGVLALSFTWTNFLERTENGTLRLGDAMRTADGGTWLDSLSADQRLVIVTPQGYILNSTGFRFVQQNESIIVNGPREFGPETDEELAVTYREADQLELPWNLILGGGGALIVLSVLVSLFVLRRRSGDESTAAVATNGGESTATEPASGDDASGVPSTDDPTTGADTDTPEPASAAAGGQDEDADEPDADEPDFELFTDEERVEYLLEQNGGRMKQANIVSETGWSDAKVSQLLSSMADEGRVTKLRLGRENLISLPDEDEGEDADDPVPR